MDSKFKKFLNDCLGQVKHIFKLYLSWEPSVCKLSSNPNNSVWHQGPSLTILPSLPVVLQLNHLEIQAYKRCSILYPGMSFAVLDVYPLLKDLLGLPSDGSPMIPTSPASHSTLHQAAMTFVFCFFSFLNSPWCFLPHAHCTCCPFFLEPCTFTSLTPHKDDLLRESPFS